jgi:hypothetical protein
MSATIVRLAIFAALVISASSAFSAAPTTPAPAAPGATPAQADTGPPPSAKSAEALGCKGLTQNDCAANHSCTWAPAGTNQAGKQVPARCRNMGCKGLDQSACSAKASCSWTEARTRKDGKEIAAACRSTKSKEQPTENKAGKALAPASAIAPTQTPTPGAQQSPAQGVVKQ